jgi:hypothetical protein
MMDEAISRNPSFYNENHLNSQQHKNWLTASAGNLGGFWMRTN